MSRSRFLLLLPITILLAVGPALAQSSARADPAFVENAGQWPTPARYLLRLSGVDAWIESGAITYDHHRTTSEGRRGHAVRMRFVGGGGRPRALEADRAAGLEHHFVGRDTTRWARNVRRYREVTLERVYDGIDVRLLVDGEALRYDLVVAPGADPSRVAMSFEGADDARLDERGELVVATRFGEVTHRGLFAYQMHGSVRVPVDCRFVRSAEGFGFELGEYDRDRELVIDPIVWSRYVGHPGESIQTGMAVDTAGNVFIAGTVSSAGYPTTVGAYDTEFSNRLDIVVTRIDAGGSTIAWSTYLGDTANDWSSRIVVDRRGQAHLAAMTESTEFPTTTGALSRVYNGGTLDGAVIKLGERGDQLIYSTYLGGSGGEDGLDIALSDSGVAFVSGWTDSRDFPVTQGVAYATYQGGNSDAFLAKLAEDGASLFFATYVGGSGDDRATSVAVDSLGSVLLGGYTESTDFPTTPGVIKRVKTGQQDGFVWKVNPNGSIPIFATLFGGSAHEGSLLLEVDRAGEIYMAGLTLSSDIPVTAGAYQTTPAGQYVARMNATGTALVYATYLGASNDRVASVALARSGFLCLTGSTPSRSFPTTTDAVSRTYGGGPSDAFVTVVRPSGATLAYSSYLGGSMLDQGVGVALDRKGDLYVSGGTASANFPNTIASTRHEGFTDFFVTKIARCFVAASAGADRTICAGDSTTIGSPALGGIPPYSYRWVAAGEPVALDTAVLRVSPATTTTYIVTATDLVGCDAIDTVVVTVNPAVLFEAGGDTAVCEGGSVRIGALASGGTPPFTYAWAPATGLSSRTSATPTARPDSTTRYVVTVVDAKGCRAVDSLTVTVNRPPRLEGISDQEICAGDSATLGVTIASGAGPFRWQWTPSTGLSSASDSTPRATPSVTTQYRVTVTDANGCSTTSPPMTVRVGATLRTRIAVTGSTRLCPGASVTLDAGEFAQYRWSNGSTERRIVVSAPGSYHVAVTSASGCSGGSDTVVVTMGARVDAAFSGPARACPGTVAEYVADVAAGATYAWRIDGARGTIESGEGTPTLRVRWTTPGIDTVALTVASADGCLDSALAVVTVVDALAPRIAPQGPTTLCTGDSVVLDAGAFAAYAWSSGATTRTIVAREAGRYWVDVEDASGCSGRSDTIEVVVREAPAPAITVLGSEICEGDSAVLVASPGFASYDWSNGMTGQRVAVRSAGRYSVTVVDAAGCRGTSEEVGIVVHPLPPAPTITQSGDTLIASDAAAWQWLLEGEPIDGATARRHVRRAAGAYAVEITDTNGCRSRADAAVVERRSAWIDSARARVGERFHLALVVSPPLRASDGVTGYTARLRIVPRDLWAHGVSRPLSNAAAPLPSMMTGTDGRIEVSYAGAQAVTGDTLFRIELEGLSTARPESIVTLEWIEMSGVDARSAGNGLVLLEGCDVGDFSAGKRVRITGARVEEGELVVTWRAPAGARPTLALTDASGRATATVPLEAGTGDEQQIRIDAPASGYYMIELRDRTERSALPIVVTR